ncbi:MAG: DUF4198 domain-containing protein [Psychromonas sp.]
MLVAKTIISATFPISGATIKAFFKTLILAISWAFSFSAHAHFQLLYTPELAHKKGGELNFKMPFSHPASSGHVMPIDPPEMFYMIKKGKKTDLINRLTEIQWSSAIDSGAAYQAQVKLRGLGDYLFIMQPAPYFEASEDIYIQQITKTIVNVGNLPTDWHNDLGLNAEIVPLTKPYAIYAGGIFSAVVKSNGKPVPFAYIEVEFLNFPPQMKNNQFAKTPIIGADADRFVSQSIYADANGTFHFSLLKAGQWGFAALGVGSQKTYKNKTLSQDAVIWVQVNKLP